MEQGFIYQAPIWVLGIFVFLLIFVFIFLGARARLAELRKAGEKEINTTSVVTAILSLLVLLLAFTFGTALTKFETRRQTIAEEANTIGTAILRCDLYPDTTRSRLRSEFRRYIDTRIAYYDAGNNRNKTQLALKETSASSERIWKIALASQDPSNTPRTILMIPAMNAMIDIVTTREGDRRSKVPPPVMLTLLLVVIVSSFLIGFERRIKQRRDLLNLAFAITTALVIYLIMELDSPRSGMINLDAAEQLIVDLRNLVN